MAKPELYLNSSEPRYERINDSMEALFDDLTRLISLPRFGLCQEEIEDLSQTLAETLYSNYVVLYSPINTDIIEH